ncbi:12742_t:CDS:2 [Funneliformis geosporum]|nr:12742_t:CDS:2 [Funneliformis geosporum]
MREVNKAFEILGDEEKRKKYGLGETNFTSASEYDYSYEEEMERLNEEQKFLARKDAINMIDFEMLRTEVFSKIKDDDTRKYGIDESELDKFKETMINAIRKRKEELKAGINNPYIDKVRVNAIKAIERELGDEGLTANDLEKYSDYKEQVNNLSKD